jgi:hypothetical protein
VAATLPLESTGLQRDVVFVSTEGTFYSFPYLMILNKLDKLHGADLADSEVSRNLPTASLKN